MAIKMFEFVLIIADDFAGANDTAAQFANLGFSARVESYPSVFPFCSASSSAFCIDPRQRRLPQEFDTFHLNVSAQSIYV
jgi:uncharacterized protein YgbK (DUF1537 family)